MYSAEHRKVIFPDVLAPLRTDEDFRTMVQPNHHNSASPLLELSIGLVSKFPLDYMHLVCLGAMKRLLVHYWTSTVPSASKLPVGARQEISKKLVQLAVNTPYEIQRRPRSLRALEFWKASELRNFLVYYGPVVLKHHLAHQFYIHFMKLTCAITILASPKLCMAYCNKAEELLLSFVTEAGNLYGNGIYTLSTHCLTHLAEDVRRFGCLASFSAFPYESFLGKLKKLVRGRALPTQQIFMRATELKLQNKLRCHSGSSSIKLAKMHVNGPVPPNFQGQQFSKVTVENKVLSTKAGDSCVKMRDGNIVQIRNLLVTDGEVSICGQYYTNISSFHDAVLQLTDIGVYKAKELSRSLSVWGVKEFSEKCVCLPLHKSTDVIFPLLPL